MHSNHFSLSYSTTTIFPFTIVHILCHNLFIMNSTPYNNFKTIITSSSQQTKLKTSNHDTNNKTFQQPTMYDILQSSKAQNIDLKLQTLGPFFRITAISLETNKELGKADGIIRVWWNKGKILHLDSIKLTKETLGMDKSIFGIGLFIGAVMIRYGYDCGCRTAELLAINDTDLYHAKLVKFYRRIGFEPVYEVTGSSLSDLADQLVWGGVGTRMDANVERLLVKWCTRFTTNKPSDS